MIMPIVVHFIFHPKSESARALARHVHQELNGNELVPGLRIPTVFCPSDDNGKPPNDLRSDFASRNLVVVLADEYLNVDDAWCRFCGNVGTVPPSDLMRFIPYQMVSEAYPLDPRLEGVSFPRMLMQDTVGKQADFLTRSILIELCRYLQSDPHLNLSSASPRAPLTVFLSHTKADIDKEPRVARQMVAYLNSSQPVDAWFDSGDIEAGSQFASAIKNGIQRTSLLVLLTDEYANREWCREEILLAKENQRPVAVIDALAGFEVRSFPYLGNVPRMRWDGDPQKCVDLILKETLRHLHANAGLQRVSTANDVVFARPPELATLIDVGSGKTVLYPDPPLGTGEAKRLQKTGIGMATPFQRLGAEGCLAGRRIALSMSESTDIALSGMDAVHLEACMLDLSRYLLIMGATLVYGGSFGPATYSEPLFEAVRTHNSLNGVKPFQRIENIRGWPLPRLTVKERSALKSSATIRELERPSDMDETLHLDFVKNPAFFRAETSREHRFAWARGMTEMRRFQADRTSSGIVARVVIGGVFGPTVKKNGATEWYMSRIPGVLEEIWLSKQYKQPVFLIGTFGGVAKLVGDVLRGRDRREMTWDYQKQAPHAPELKALYESRGLDWDDYPYMVQELRSGGLTGLNPLLSETEQNELFQAVDPMKMAQLIMEGIMQIPV